MSTWSTVSQRSIPAIGFLAHKNICDAKIYSFLLAVIFNITANKNVLSASLNKEIKNKEINKQQNKQTHIFKKLKKLNTVNTLDL